MTRPRVLANLCWMVPGSVGGSEEYTTRLLAAMASAEPDIDVELTVAAMAGVAAAHPELSALRWRELAVSGRLRPLRAVVESTWLARESRRHDIVHHFGGRIPAIRGTPAIVTVHDIQPLDHPENFSAPKRAYLARALPRSIAIARLVITPSEWVAERVASRFDVGEERIRVVPSTFRGPRHRQRGEARASEGLPIPAVGSPVIVYPAMTHPHKDHSTLLAAFGRVREQYPDARLLLTGAPGRIHTEIEHLVSATPGAEHLGRIGDDALAELVDRADVLAFPSRYEGFGLPVLEAMRVGTPVVAADATSLPEVLGGGGTLVEPGDVEAWAGALCDVIENGPDEATLDAARARVEHYSPANARSRLLAAWRSALDAA